MDNEKLIQEFIKQFTGPKRREVEDFLNTLVQNNITFAEAARRATDAFDETKVSIRDIAGSIDGVLDSLTTSNRVVNEGRKSFNKLLSITRKIQDDQAGIYDLSLKELKSTKARAQSEISRLGYITRSLELRVEEAGTTKVLEAAELELLNIGRERLFNQRAILDRIDERIKKEKELESALGLTGAVLDNLNRIGIRALGGIGVNLGTLQSAFDEAREAGKNTAREIEALDNAETFSNLSKRILTLGASLDGVKKGLVEAFDDPLTLGLGLLKQITDQVAAVNSAQNEFRRLTGRTADNLEQIRSRAVTVVDVVKTLTGITEQLGLAADAVFSNTQLLRIAEAQELLGLSLKEAVNLGTVSRLTNRTQEEYNNSLLRGADAANTLFKSAVSPGVALRDAANASSDIVLSLGMAPGKLGAAATAARALGLELSRIDSLADSLLDFETSIEATLEAQLVTGRNINLNRARELALLNDYEGLTKEIQNNIVTATEFAEMNRYEQQATAKALGLSRQELGEVVMQQQLAAGLTDAQRRSVLGINQSQLEQLDLQKSIEKSIQSITQQLAGPLEAFADILEKSNAIYGVIITGMVFSITKFFTGVITAGTELRSALTTAGLLKTELVQAAAASNAIRIPGTGRIATEAQIRAGFAGKAAKDRLLAGTAGAGVSALATKGLGKSLLRAIPYVGLLYTLFEVGRGIFADDMISMPKNRAGYGDRILLDKGTVTSLNNNDTVVAGTNLGGGSTAGSSKRTEYLLERLVTAVEKGGNVYIDGNKAGEALVLGNFKV